MRRGILLTCCLTVLQLLALRCESAEYTVDLTGAGDFRSIQAAIYACLDGDTVMIQPGTYQEHIRTEGKNIVIRSVAPWDQQVVESTIIDGEGEDAVFRFDGSETPECMLQGLTIQNGEHDWAGGIIGGDPYYSEPPDTHTHASIQNCIVRNHRGNGLFRCSGLIENCLIEANSGDGLQECNGSISNCVVRGNRLGLSYCDGLLVNCTIQGNTGEYYSGGLYNCSCLAVNCLIIYNETGSEYGAGVYLGAGEIVSCTIYHNSAQDTGGLRRYDGVIRDCIIWGNSASYQDNQVSECSTPTYSCIQDWSGGGEGNTSSDPLFASGPLGDFYLSQIGTGQTQGSPCVDAGSGQADEYGLHRYTSRTDGYPDQLQLDIGFHYSAFPSSGIEHYLAWGGFRRYRRGETIRVFVSLKNPGVETSADVYLGLVKPSGRLLCFTESGFTHVIAPWFPALRLPSGFFLPWTELLNLKVPDSEPYFEPGTYILALAAPRRSSQISSEDISYSSFELAGSHLGPDFYISADTGHDSNEGSQSAPFKTITKALETIRGSQASPVTFHVAAGTYSSSTNGETFPLSVGSWVTLSGEEPNTTILDAEQQATPLVYFERVSDCAVENFTITGSSEGGIGCNESTPRISNNIVQGNYSSSGGGIYVLRSRPEIIGNEIYGNEASRRGGGIDCYGDLETRPASSALISANTIEANTADLGGGICCENGASPMITGNSIRANSALEDDSGGNGGGIFCDNSSLVILDNTIENNRAKNSGGGIHLEYYDDIEIRGNVIVGNSTESEYGKGGGISLGTGQSFTIETNIVAGNSASCGAGIDLDYTRSNGTIRDNSIEGNSAKQDGGGLSVSSCSPEILGNAIEGNSAEYRGGGVYCSWCDSHVESNKIGLNSAAYGGGFYGYNSGVNVLSNTLSENAAAFGGGMYCINIPVYDPPSPTIEGNSLLSNVADGNGGGICCYSCSPSIQGNTILDNVAKGDGGGIVIFGDCSPTVSTNLITCNSADGEGGGISCDYLTFPTIMGNLIADNSARKLGGGISCYRSSPALKDNLIICNSVNGDGGGLSCRRFSAPSTSNNTIAQNIADGIGGGIYCSDDGCCPEVLDCIVWGNGDDLWGCTATFCCIGNLDEGKGNIHDDPIFVEGPFGEFYLHQDSPCIDAGSRSAEEAGLADMTTQADGAPDAGTVDMGYHYPIP